MAFSKSNRPTRPGSYTRWVALVQERLVPVQNETVFVPFTHNWGPLDTPVTLGSYQDFLSVYGDVAGPGKVAMHQVFNGEGGIDDHWGAGTVIACRIAASSAAKATRTLNNTTPAVAITLSGKYFGTRGNTLRATVQVNAQDGTKKDLIIKDGNVILETYTALATATQTFVDEINLLSDWVTATAGVTGVALADVADAAFAGGLDGSTLVAGDWTELMAVAAAERFAVFAPYDLTDAGIIASLKAWAHDLNSPLSAQQKNKRFQVVIGGGAGDTVALAISRSATLDSPYFINLGAGTYTDELHGTLTTSQLVPRLAGILANRGDAESLSFARLPGLKFNANPPSDTDIGKALAAGVMVIGRDSHVAAPLRLDGERTTLITNSADQPLSIYKSPKFVFTMGNFETQINEFMAFKVVGKLPVTAKDTREFVLGEARRIVGEFVRRGAVSAVPAPSVEIDLDPPPQPTDEFIALVYEWVFGRSTEQVYHSVVVQ
jgi:hypothetical protein